MSNYQHFIDLVREMSGQKNTMTIPRIYIKIAGDITAGIFLSQLVWYSDKGTRKDGWFWKSNKEWKEEIELSYAQVKRCTRDLEAKGFIETKVMRAKGAPTTHYKVDMDTIIMAMIDLVASDSPILEKVENRKSQKSNLEKVENENLDKPEKHEQHKPNINNNKGATPDLTEHEQDELMLFGILGQTDSERSTDLELQAQRDIETVWIKRLSDDVKAGLIIFLVAMWQKFPYFTPPRDKDGQGEWGKGVSNHLANYPLVELPDLYSAAIDLQIHNELDIYRPQSLDKAMIKCRQQTSSNGHKIVASY